MKKKRYVGIAGIILGLILGFLLFVHLGVIHCGNSFGICINSLMPFRIGYTCDCGRAEYMCETSIRLINHAKGVAAIKNGLQEGDTVEKEQVTRYIDRGMSECEAGGIYSFNKIGIPATCSFHTPQEPSKPSEKAEE